MQVKNFVNDFPFPVDFQEGKQIRKSMACPIVELQPDCSHRLEDVDAGDPALQLRGWPILVVPVEELLNWSGEEITTDVTKNRGVRMKGCLHICPTAGLAAVDICLDSLGNGVVVAQARRCCTRDLFCCLHWGAPYKNKFWTTILA